MTDKHKIAIIGIGNQQANGDGAGIEVLRLLEDQWYGDKRLLLDVVDGDLSAIAGMLPAADRFVFVYAGAEAPAADSRSAHQTEIQDRMRALESRAAVTPFPQWQVWDIVADTPRQPGTGPKPGEGCAVERMVDKLNAHISGLLEEIADGSPA